MEHLHFTLIPLMSPGHIIPMINMAKLLAQRGLTVTIIVTPLNAARFTSSSLHDASICLLQVSFPAEEAGLPPDCESVDCVPSYELIRNFYVAIKLWQQPVEQKLSEMKHSPNCIICDKHIAWTAETSMKFQIPRIIFDGMSCFTQLISHQLNTSKIHESNPPAQPFAVPGLPGRTIEFTRLQLPSSFNPGTIDVTEFRKEIKESESQAIGVVVNTFQELEKAYVDEFKKVKGGKVWSIGPLSLCSDNDSGSDSDSDSGRGNCLKWLDDRKAGSVIYACLGSLSRLSTDQFIELALGLESSNHFFILVVKAGSISADIEKWILDEWFEERTSERGVVIRGWAPQVSILAHPSVGAFLTHCGWNSTLEAVSAGLPMITWPMFAEQFLNEKLVVEVLETGVGVGARAVVHLGGEVQPENRVTRDGVRGGIERIMDSGEEGEGRRRRARELKEMAKRSVRVGGSSYDNLTLLIQEIAGLSKGEENAS